MLQPGKPQRYLGAHALLELASAIGALAAGVFSCWLNAKSIMVDKTREVQLMEDFGAWGMKYVVDFFVGFGAVVLPLF